VVAGVEVSVVEEEGEVTGAEVVAADVMEDEGDVDLEEGVEGVTGRGGRGTPYKQSAGTASTGKLYFYIPGVNCVCIHICFSRSDFYQLS